MFILPPSLPFVRFFYSPRGGVRRGYSFTLSPIGEGCTFFFPEEKNGGVFFSAAVDKRIDSLASLAPVCVMRRFGAVSPMGPHSVPVGDFLLSPLMHSGPRCFQPDLRRLPNQSRVFFGNTLYNQFWEKLKKIRTQKVRLKKG